MGGGHVELEKLWIAMLAIDQELQGVKQKVSLTSDERNQGARHVSQITEVDSKVDSISISLLDSNVKVAEADEIKELVQEHNLEVNSLKDELKKAKATESMLDEAKKSIDELTRDLDIAKKGNKYAPAKSSSFLQEHGEKSTMFRDALSSVVSKERKSR